MSDKKNTSIEDRGWNEMKALLDKELPVKRRRRGIIFWIFPSVTILAGFILMMFFLKQDKGQNVAIVQKSLLQDQLESEEELVSKEDQQNVNFTNQITAEEDVSSTNSEKLQLLEITEEKKNPTLAQMDQAAIVGTHTVFGKNKSVSDTISKAEVHQENLPEKGYPKNIVSGRDDTKLPPQTEINKSELVSPATKKEKHESTDLGPIGMQSEHKNELDRLFILPMKSISGVKPNDVIAASMDQAIIVNAKSNSLSPYLFSNANYQSTFDGRGLGIGAGLNYGNSNWETYIEFAYMKSNYNNDNGDGGSDANAPLFGPNLGIELEFPESEKESEMIDKELQKFNLIIKQASILTRGIWDMRFGLGLRKHLIGGLRLDIGLSYVRLLKATNRPFEINLVMVTNLTEITTNYYFDETELYNRGKYSSFDLVPHMGLEYGLTANLFLNLHVNYGMRNLIVNSSEEFNRAESALEDQMYRRNIGLKVRYEF